MHGFLLQLHADRGIMTGFIVSENATQLVLR